ncbi:winged helix-turn-helix transcriptional regulator [Egicoccus sp. AB-alg2]|uniref:winged helix-turn-helix transcriptional regulator n=1 Tax=Egicoccus sp. AB-alg2 TaxID=3242693 RepID=UPI00359E8F25
MQAMEAAALAAAVEQVGDRWLLRIVHALLAGPRRFGELQTELGVAPNVLTQRLGALSADGLVVAEPYQERPRRHTYVLTERGRDLGGVLRLLAAWQADELGPRHPACGTPLQAHWWCPTCERLAEDPAGAVVHL